MKSDYWKWISAAAMVAVTATSISGCATPDSSTPDGAPRPDLTVGAVDLSEVCPATITVQTDWNPQAEQGGLFELLGDNPVIDRTTASITGPLMTRGEYTGVDLQIRAGGPAIGQQAVSAQMYTDPTITLGYVNTDEAIRLAASMPTTAVFAPLEISPQIIMWDPRTWPDVHTIADLGQTGATVRYFGGATYMDYLVSAGLLDRQQIDGGYDGTPGNWVAAAGKDAQQGFVGVEDIGRIDPLQGLLQTACRPDELIAQVRLPRAQRNCGYAFTEMAIRHGDFAVIAVAAAADGDRLVIGIAGAADMPVVVEWDGSEAAAPAEALNDLAWSIGCRDDLHATAAYRRHLIRTLGRRTIEEARACRR